MMPVAMMPYFVKLVVKPEKATILTAALIASTLVFGVLFTPGLACLMDKKFDKRTVLLGICVMGGVLLTSATFTHVDLMMLFAFALPLGVGLSGSQLIPDALLGDIVDCDELHTGERNEGVCTIVETNLQQWIEIPAGVVPLMWLGMQRYENNAGCSCGCGVVCPDDCLRWNCSEHILGDVGHACGNTPDSSLFFQNHDAPCTQQNDDVEWVLRICAFLIPGVCFALK